MEFKYDQCDVTGKLCFLIKNLLNYCTKINNDNKSGYICKFNKLINLSEIRGWSTRTCVLRQNKNKRLKV